MLADRRHQSWNYFFAFFIPVSPYLPLLMLLLCPRPLPISPVRRT